MIHEQFMELRVGDVVQFFGHNYEIKETRNNGIGIETNAIIVDSRLSGNRPVTFRRRNGLWIIVEGYQEAQFDINKLNIVSKKSSEENSIEHFKKKIEETKTELVRLETTLKGLEDSKRMKELTVTISNLIVGDFYTVKFDNGNVVTGKFHARLSKQVILFYVHTNNEGMVISNCVVNHIKQIIHRPNFTYDYKSLLKKIDTFNSELENA